MGDGAEVLRFVGWPPVDAALWRKFVNRLDECTDADYACLPEPFRAVVDRRRHNDAYFAAVDDDTMGAVVDDLIAHDLRNVERIKAGLPDRPQTIKLSEARIEEWCARARIPGFRVTGIPLDEWTLIANYEPHYQQLCRALGST